MRTILMTMIWLAVAGSSAAQQTDDTRRLIVEGSGSVEVAPDMATITLGVQERAEAAEAALDATSQKVAAIFDALEEAGVEARDMQTTGLSLYPQRESGTLGVRVTAYEASNGVTVRVRDLDGLGALLDTIAGVGANRIDNLTFGLQDPRPVEDQATTAAVADARARAELLAEAAGVTLGAISEISEVSGGGGGPRPMQARMEMADALPIAGGEVDVTAQVRIVWEIE